MNPSKQPSKEKVREYMRKRIGSQEPLPDIAQIKRELGLASKYAYRSENL
jgi:hypothetical protein